MPEPTNWANKVAFINDTLFVRQGRTNLGDNGIVFEEQVTPVVLVEVVMI